MSWLATLLHCYVNVESMFTVFIFLAPSGAQEVAISVRHFGDSLSSAHNIHLFGPHLSLTLSHSLKLIFNRKDGA